MSDDRWEAIWRAAEDSVRRLLVGDDSPPAAVLELVPPVESEPEDEVLHGVEGLPVEPEGES